MNCSELTEQLLSQLLSATALSRLMLWEMRVNDFWTKQLAHSQVWPGLWQQLQRSAQLVRAAAD